MSNIATSINKGLRWSGLGQVVGVILRTVVSIVLARLLAPEEFGLLAMASIVTGFVGIMQFMGTSAVIIQRKDLTERMLNSIFWLNTSIGFILTVAIYFTSPIFASIYESGEVEPVIELLAMTLFISSIGGVPGAYLYRNMKFEVMAKITVLSAVVQGAVAIYMASNGYGIWALVFGNIVGTSVESLGTLFKCGWKPAFMFSIKDIKEILKFCLNLTGSYMITFVMKNSDKFIIGKWLGADQLGYYTIPYRFTLYPIELFSPILGRVLFPAYSKMQDDVAMMRETFVRACGGVLFLILPAMIGLMVLAEPFVITVLSYKWASSIPILQVLAVVAIMHSLASPIYVVFLAKGKTNWIFWLSVATSATTIVALMIGLNWGIIGVAISYAISKLPLTIISIWFALKLVKLSFLDFVKGLTSYWLYSILMGAFVYGFRYMMDIFNFGLDIILYSGVAVGVIFYFLLIKIFKPKAFYDMLNVISSDENSSLYKWSRKVF